MTSQRQFDVLLRSWFEESAPSAQPQDLLESILTVTAHSRPHPAWLVGLRGEPMRETGRPGLNRFAPLALAATAIAVAILIGIGLILRSPNVGPPISPDPARAGASNGWIAYSTAPADYEGPVGDATFLTGSDIYLVLEGKEPRLIADRNGGDTWNVCPAFSPGGRMLAFGEETNTGRAIVVLGVSPSGSIVEPKLRLVIAGTGLAPCPRWSSDGTRVAYVEGGAVVVRGLDGSSPAMTDGDPRLADFARRRTGMESLEDSIPSPSGELIARDVGGTLVVERADGSDSRIVAQLNAYALAGWSPDGRWILSMQDVSGFHFTMHATSIDEPFETIAIVERVRVNHGRSWPGNGDVSWQPVYP